MRLFVPEIRVTTFLLLRLASVAVLHNTMTSIDIFVGHGLFMF